MLCATPYMLGSIECPCGRCTSCRIDRRRVWAHRILLESYKHGDSCFVTLTYDDEHVPNELVKSHYQNWLKRLRKVLAPKKIRYFLAGEYAPVTFRPHYHAAIFGLDTWSAGGQLGREGLVRDTWPHGFTHVGELNWQSAQYIAKYVTKKVLDHGKSVDEFSRMSLRPGIGSGAMEDVARAIFNGSVGRDVLGGDVPATLSHGKRLLPLGRYLRRQLRGELGFASKDTPSEAAQMFAMRQAAKKAEDRSSLKAAGYSSWDANKLILDMRTQKINNRVARFNVRDQHRSLK